MKIPWILYADLAATAVPAGAAAFTRAAFASPPRRLMLLWSAVLFSINVLALWLALRGRNNHWLTYVVTPVTGMLALWALSLWQSRPVVTLWLRLVVPLLAVTWIGLVLLVEDTQTFSLVAEPFAALLVLGAAVYTLVANSDREAGPLFQQDWLWVGLGLAVYSGAAIALPPAARWLLTRSPALVSRVYEAKAVFDIVAQLAIARGVTCPTSAFRSGGSSSRVSSPSPSSSSASSSRS